MPNIAKYFFAVFLCILLNN